MIGHHCSEGCHVSCTLRVHYVCALRDCCPTSVTTVSSSSNGGGGD